MAEVLVSWMKQSSVLVSESELEPESELVPEQEKGSEPAPVQAARPLTLGLQWGLPYLAHQFLIAAHASVGWRQRQAASSCR
eukprot:COSAG06_NODE_28318_length_576_cov_1.922432_2_plen_82_part_00